MTKGLISIVAPCYNREKIIFRFLDSVLAQTYRNIQLILVDDGSTDQTAKVIESYRCRFEQAGIEMEYHCKENGGVSSAINFGLQFVKGEFFCWPDSDDWYDPKAMEIRVKYLNEHPEIGIVSCDADFYNENDLSMPLATISGKNKERFSPNQFELLLNGKSLVCPICHMVRTEALFASIPTRRIFDSRHGQNLQILLPIYYKYKRAFIDETLCHYLVLEGSLSRSADTFEKELSYRNDIETLVIETLQQIEMPLKQRLKYIRFVRIKNTRRRLLLAQKYADKSLGKKQLDLLRSLKGLRVRDWMTYHKI